MEPRRAAIALALAGQLALSPASARAETPASAPQTGATEVTVDLSDLAREPATPASPLAQTADPQLVGAAVLIGTGLLAVGAGGTRCHLGRREADDGTEDRGADGN